jgi:hypothetical protein
MRPVLVAPPLLHLHAAGTRTPQVTEPVSVLLALRHGPSVALAAVHAAVAQRNVSRLDVVVLDVGCTEATHRALNREYGDDPRVRLLDTACVPSGWSRASHRAQQLAVGARGRILFFADPAAPLGPYAAAAAASLLRRQKLDLLVLDAGGSRRTGRFAVATDTEAYWRIGGHRAVAHDPHPLALLRAMRRAHAATGVADGRRVIPATTRARLADLPAEPPEQYFREREAADSTLGSLSTSARRMLAALWATGVDLADAAARPAESVQAGSMEAESAPRGERAASAQAGFMEAESVPRDERAASAQAARAQAQSAQAESLRAESLRAEFPQGDSLRAELLRSARSIRPGHRPADNEDPQHTMYEEVLSEDTMFEVDD